MTRPVMAWSELHWQRLPIDFAQASAMLRQLAADRRSPALTFEVRSRTERPLTYLLGGLPAPVASTSAALRSHLGARLTRAAEDVRPSVNGAGRLRATSAERLLRGADGESIVRAVLHALMQVREGEQLVIQVILGPRRLPLAVPSRGQQPGDFMQALSGGERTDSEQRAAKRAKLADHGFATTVRLGVSASSRERRRALLLGLVAAIRSSESAGMHLGFTPEPARRINQVAAPWRWPLRLAAPEVLLVLGWPVGAADLPGQPSRHPKVLEPASGTTGEHRVIGDSTVPGLQKALSLRVEAALHHTHVVGPTGVGKSTLLANLILQDVADGRPVVVIEPKGDLVADVLSRIPVHRRDDVVVLDPTDSSPVGLNPLDLNGRKPELAADQMLAVFKQLYGRAVGPRSQDILYAGLLTLARRRGTSLALLPVLLTNPHLRRELTADIDDPLVLEPFWATFENWSEAERAAAIAPVMNKLRPLLRPTLRGIVGQPAPRLHLADVIRERRILLVPLQRGLIGSEAASLLGSLLVAQLWQVIQGRAGTSSHRRHPLMVVLDEVQDYLHTGTDLGEALAQARGYGAGLTLAHQYLGQLPKAMREAVLANTRSRICFQLEASDAAALSRGHSELEAADLLALRRFEVYASIFSGGQVTSYASARTRNLEPATSDAGDLRRRSRERWGQPLAQIDDQLRTLIDGSGQPSVPTGRRPRRTP